MGAQRNGVKQKRLRFISRIDSYNTHTWWVRIWKEGASVTSQSFSDGLCGGKRKALHEAIAYRDRLVSELNIEPRKTTTPRRSQINNTSGIIGVSLSETYKESSGNWYYSWNAKFQKGKGKQRRQATRGFSISKYGYKKAYELAVTERFRQIGEPVPANLKPPVKPKYV